MEQIDVQRSTRRTAAGMALAACTLVGTMAFSGVAHAEEPVTDTVTTQSVAYVDGSSIRLGSCKGWLNRRTSDGYIQAVGQSWGDSCTVWLERRVIGEYDFKRVSDIYPIRNSKAFTGFHWNGKKAGSTVCIASYEGGKLIAENCNGKTFW